MNRELAPSDVMSWDSPEAVLQTFHELGLDPDSTSWFRIESTDAEEIADIDVKVNQEQRCALVLNENLHVAWLVGFVSRPVGCPSVRYHQFDPTNLIESELELRETLDRLNALDPETPSSTSEALTKSELNNRFSNTISALYQDVSNQISDEYNIPSEKAENFSGMLLICALRSKVLSEHSEQAEEPFRDVFIDHTRKTIFDDKLQQIPEVLRPTWRSILPILQSSSAQRLSTSFDSQHNLLQQIVDLFDSKLSQFNWLLTESTWSQLDQVTSHTIGIALERHLTEDGGGSFNTPPALTSAIADEAIEDVLVERLNDLGVGSPVELEEALGESLQRISSGHPVEPDSTGLDEEIGDALITDVLPKLQIADPVVGSGSFSISALDSIVSLRNFLHSVTDDIDLSSHYDYPESLDRTRPRSLAVWTTITQNIYGVDIDPEAVSVARFRLELAYICTKKQGEPFVPPRLAHNIKQGNSLIGKPHTFDPPYWTGQLPLSAFYEDSNSIDELTQGVASCQSLTNEISPALEQYRSAPVGEEHESLQLICERIENRATDIDESFRIDHTRSSSDPMSEEWEEFHWPIEFPDVMSTGGFDVLLLHTPWSERNIGESIPKSIRDYFYSVSQSELGSSGGWHRSSDIEDAYFLHRADDIASNGGTIAALVNESVLTAAGSYHVRYRFLNTTNITRVANFTNQSTFGQIDRRFKYSVLISQARGYTDELYIGSGLVSPKNYKDQGNYYSVDREFLNRFSPNTLSFPQISRSIQLEALRQILDSPRITDNSDKKGWTVNPTGEFNQTTDEDYISESKYENSDPIYRGSNIYQHAHLSTPEVELEKPDLWTIPREAANGLSTIDYLTNRKRSNSSDKLPSESSRIVYRRITSSSNERSMIACLLPENYYHINSLNSIDPHRGEQTTIKRRLLLLGLLNSIPYDYLLRRKISTSIPKYTLFETRAPFITEENPLFEPIWKRVASLNLLGEPFQLEREELGVTPAIQSEDKRRLLRAEIDAAAFDLFGFEDPETVAEILSDFGFVRNPRVMDSDYHDLVLNAFEGGDYNDAS